jgi:hypothetical protein
MEDVIKMDMNVEDFIGCNGGILNTRNAVWMEEDFHSG